jgi:hypothetical protein
MIGLHNAYIIGNRALAAEGGLPTNKHAIIGQTI